MPFTPFSTPLLIALLMFVVLTDILSDPIFRPPIALATFEIREGIPSKNAETPRSFT
nr:MAG TPA: hypothetical protein [Caudoviricetes sp.]